MRNRWGPFQNGKRVAEATLSRLAEIRSWRSAATVLLAQCLDGPQLGDGLGQAGGGRAIVELGVLLVEGLLGGLDGLLGGSLVEILGAGRGVGQDLHHVRLHFDEAAGDVEDLFLTTLLDHAHRARLEVAEQGRVVGQDTQVAEVTMGNDHFHQPGEQLLFRTDDVAMDCHSHTNASVVRSGGVAPALVRRPSPGATHYSFLAFSMASSMVPTM